METCSNYCIQKSVKSSQ